MIILSCIATILTILISIIETHKHSHTHECCDFFLIQSVNLAVLPPSLLPSPPVMSRLSTFLPEDPPLVHAGGEEDGRLGDAHQQVGDGQVDDEHVGWRPQAAAPAEEVSGAATSEHSGSDFLFFASFQVHVLPFPNVSFEGPSLRRAHPHLPSQKLWARLH